MMLDYSGYATSVKGLGPGRRVVLWVRGCSIGCPGCMTSDLWAKGEPRPIEPLADELTSHLQLCDGLTISGGEPFEQPQQLAQLISLMRSRLEFNVVCYSGFTLARLRRQAATRALLDCIDVLVDGPYRAKASNTLQWRGSDNQRAVLLSDRAKSMDPFDTPVGEVRELQLQRLPNGHVRVIGIPKRQDMEKLKALMGSRGLEVKEAP